MKRSLYRPSLVTVTVEEQPPIRLAECPPSSSCLRRDLENAMEEDCEADSNRSNITSRANLTAKKDEELALQRLSKVSFTIILFVTEFL